MEQLAYKLSIALITFNGETFIKEQLDSILNQSIQNFELIICDDCSTDSTYKILSEYATTDQRIKLFLNESNLGFLKNLERAISLCTGEYIAFSDQDDIWEKDHLEVLLSNIEDNYLICGDSLFVNNDDNSIQIRSSKMYYMNIHSLKTNEQHFLRLLCMENIYQGAAMMVNRQFLDLTIPFPTDIKFHDIWFTLVAMAMNKFIYIPKVIIQHRKHSKSVTGSLKATDMDLKISNSKKDYISQLSKLHIPETSKRIIEQVTIFFLHYESLIIHKSAINFWVSNYSILYATENKKRLYYRFFKTFIYSFFTKYRRMTKKHLKRVFSFGKVHNNKFFMSIFLYVSIL